MNQLEKVSVLLRNADAPRYIVDRIEGIECKLVEFCTDIEDLITEDDFLIRTSSASLLRADDCHDPDGQTASRLKDEQI